MKTFKQHRAFVEYSHPQKDKILKYVEFMYSVNSELNGIANLQERKETALKQAGLKIEDMKNILEEKDEAFKSLRHKFLSEFQFHNDYQNLITFQQMLWNVQRDALANFDVLKYDKAVDVMLKLSDQCALHFQKIYGDSQIIDIAKDQIKQNRSLEEKLKDQKK